MYLITRVHIRIVTHDGRHFFRVPNIRLENFFGGFFFQNQTVLGVLKRADETLRYVL